MEASFYDKIMDQQRLEPEFFRVGFYGKKFPFFLRVCVILTSCSITDVTVSISEVHLVSVLTRMCIYVCVVFRIRSLCAVVMTMSVWRRSSSACSMSSLMPSQCNTPTSLTRPSTRLKPNVSSRHLFSFPNTYTCTPESLILALVSYFFKSCSLALYGYCASSFNFWQFTLTNWFINFTISSKNACHACVTISYAKSYKFELTPNSIKC